MSIDKKRLQVESKIDSAWIQNELNFQIKLQTRVSHSSSRDLFARLRMFENLLEARWKFRAR